MKTNWWLKLYTIPALKSYGKMFAFPIVLSGVFDWDYAATMIAYILFLKHITTRHKAPTFHKNLNFHRNHIPLHVLKANFLKHLIILGCASVCSIGLFGLSANLFVSTNDIYSFGLVTVLCGAIGASGLLVFCEIKIFEVGTAKNEYIWYQKLLLGISFLLIYFIGLFTIGHFLDVMTYTAVMIISMVLVFYREEFKIQFHEIKEKQLSSFYKFLPISMIVCFGIVFGVGFVLTRDFDESKLSSRDKLGALETWPGLVGKINGETFVKMEKYVYLNEHYELLFEKLDKADLAEMSPEIFVESFRPRLVHSYLKYGNPSSEKLQYIKESLIKNNKKWLSSVNQSNYNRLLSNIDYKLGGASPHVISEVKSGGTVEGVEREVANIQEIPEEAKAQE